MSSISSYSEKRCIFSRTPHHLPATNLHPEAVLHVHDPVLEDQDVHQVGEVHDAVVDDEPDVVVVLGLVLREDVPEGDDPGVVQEAEGHHRQPTWASDDHINKNNK